MNTKATGPFLEPCLCKAGMQMRWEAAL